MALLLYVGRLCDPNGVFSVEAKNLAGIKADRRFGIVNLCSTDLDASLFNQS